MSRQSIRIYEEPIIKRLFARKSNQLIESKQNKAQCNLDRQTAKILALSSGDVSKFEFLKIFLPERGLLQK